MGADYIPDKRLPSRYQERGFDPTCLAAFFLPSKTEYAGRGPEPRYYRFTTTQMGSSV